MFKVFFLMFLSLIVFSWCSNIQKQTTIEKFKNNSSKETDKVFTWNEKKMWNNKNILEDENISEEIVSSPNFNTKETVLSTEEIIKNIRTEYSKINKNINTYKKIEKENNWESTEWGNITYYYDKYNLPKKIIAKYFWEMWDNTYEFYYKDWKVFFVFQFEKKYSTPIYYKWFDENDFIITENRYYFHNNKMIKWLDNSKKNINLNTNEAKNTEKEILKQNYKLLWVNN